MKGFLRDGLSINEFKISSTVIGFLILLGFAIYNYMATGDITNNVVEILKIFILVIGGVNGLDAISSAMTNINKVKSQTKQPDEPKNFG